MGIMNRPIAIVGPTCTGKSVLALRLAEKLGGEIVNGDAMQLYYGMNIGTAKLSLVKRKNIPHYQIDILNIKSTSTAADYQNHALNIIESITSRGLVPILVGGSMLYVQSVLDNWSFPITDIDVRSSWENKLSRVGTTALHSELNILDPVAGKSICIKDSRRLVRALEVIELTGNLFSTPISKINKPKWDTLIVGLDLETNVLNSRLWKRTSMMFNHGLVDEVRKLINIGFHDELTAAKALGYAQILKELNKTRTVNLNFSAACSATFISTKRYAKRQRAWFRRDHRINWLDGTNTQLTNDIFHMWRTSF